MIRPIRFLPALLSTAALFGLPMACAHPREPARGQLMLAIQTDMSLPKDVDRVVIEVSSFGVVRLSNEYAVGGPADLKIPATLGIVGGDDASAPVTIRVIAKQGAKARTLRQVVTTIPETRVATLRVPIQWLCDATAQTAADGAVSSTCGAGTSCVAGSCVSDEVDSTLLPDYDPAAIFGGGTGNGDGMCFDTLACMQTSEDTELQSSDCSVAMPQLAREDSVNVAIALPAGGDGICGDSACFIPLDADRETGFVVEGGRVHLARGVCSVLGRLTSAKIRVSAGCASKTTSTPTCGPWSATSGGGGGTGTLPPFPGTDGGSGAENDAGTADGGSCQPYTGPYSVQWRPIAGVHQNVCTPQEIASFITACLSQSATQAECSSVLADKPACRGCLIGDGTHAGAIVSVNTISDVPNGVFVNHGGCRGALHGAVACDQAWTNLHVCTLSACREYSTPDACWATCTNAAASTACNAQSSSVDANCTVPPPNPDAGDGGPDAGDRCPPVDEAVDFLTNADTLARFVCGP